MLTYGISFFELFSCIYIHCSDSTWIMQKFGGMGGDDAMGDFDDSDEGKKTN